MSVQVENLEKNTAKLTIEVPAEKFEEAVQHSYNKNKGKFNIPGFRKGKAPFNMIKKMYGVGVFYEDAVDEVIDASYRTLQKRAVLRSFPVRLFPSRRSRKARLSFTQQ